MNSIAIILAEKNKIWNTVTNIKPSYFHSLQARGQMNLNLFTVTNMVYQTFKQDSTKN